MVLRKCAEAPESNRDREDWNAMVCFKCADAQENTRDKLEMKDLVGLFIDKYITNSTVSQ